MRKSGLAMRVRWPTHNSAHFNWDIGNGAAGSRRRRSSRSNLVCLLGICYFNNPKSSDKLFGLGERTVNDRRLSFFPPAANDSLGNDRLTVGSGANNPGFFWKSQSFSRDQLS